MKHILLTFILLFQMTPAKANVIHTFPHSIDSMNTMGVDECLEALSAVNLDSEKANKALSSVINSFYGRRVIFANPWDLHNLHNDLTLLTLAFRTNEQTKAIWSDFLLQINNTGIPVLHPKGVVTLATNKELSYLNSTDRPDPTRVHLEYLDPKSKSDFNQLVPLYKEGFIAAEDEIKIAAAINNSPAVKTVLAKHGSEIVGMGTKLSLENRFFIFNFARKADAAFMSIGEQMMREITAEPGLYILFVESENTSAIKLYKQMGFTKCGAEWNRLTLWLAEKISYLFMGDVTWMYLEQP